MTGPAAKDGELRHLHVALVVNNARRRGGAERQCFLLGQELAHRGISAAFLCLAGGGPLLEEARFQQIQTGSVQLRYPLSLFYFPFNLIRARRFFLQYRPSILVGYTSVPNLYAGWLWRCSGARAFVWNQRNAGLDRPPSFLEQVALRQASAFIANSPSAADFLCQARGGQNDRIWLIPNGVTIPPVAARPETSRTVVCVANGRPEKDHSSLLEAWKRVQRQWQEKGPRPRLILAGDFQAYPAYTRQVRAQADSLEMAETVEWTGEVTDIPELLQQAAIGVLTSHSEGLPNAVLEYMAAGLPVVATDLPGIRQALGPEAVSLAAVGDVQAVADRLYRLLLNPEQRKEEGFRNRQRAQKEFSVAAMANQTLQVLQQVLP